MPPIHKKVLHPSRLRRIPTCGFSWIDRRFVTDGFAAETPRDQLLLYLFLCVVADKDGLSFYGDRRLGEILKTSTADLDRARRSLEKRDLILYRYPIYQILSLPDEPIGTPARHPARDSRADSPPTSIGEIIDRLPR